jgi:hypothetical protein
MNRVETTCLKNRAPQLSYYCAETLSSVKLCLLVNKSDSFRSVWKETADCPISHYSAVQVLKKSFCFINNKLLSLLYLLSLFKLSLEVFPKLLEPTVYFTLKMDPNVCDGFISHTIHERREGLPLPYLEPAASLCQYTCKAYVKSTK